MTISTLYGLYGTKLGQFKKFISFSNAYELVQKSLNTISLNIQLEHSQNIMKNEMGSPPLILATVLRTAVASLTIANK